MPHSTNKVVSSKANPRANAKLTTEIGFSVLIDLHRLTHPRNSRKLKDCEGCGSKGLPPRITYPEIQALEIEAKSWQITYLR